MGATARDLGRMDAVGGRGTERGGVLGGFAFGCFGVGAGAGAAEAEADFSALDSFL